ncbi:ComEA family DNA-binding protein [Streptomyces bathyalis]|uniref:ComEA family DNA-binding protein n=1 Tax=Streptomyces bathyalis TaxID=2710756 RepID=UPI001FEB94CF|nr:ComEA family DNA-binding protein [Streptomyces bathyalis]
MSRACGTSGAAVLPRAAAMASARESVRRSRARRAAMRPSAVAPTAAAAREFGDAARPTPESAGPAGADVAGTPGAWGRARLALCERLPLWVQLRCGIEPRTLLALAVVLVVAVGFAVHHFWTGRPEAVRAPSAERAPAGSAAEAPDSAGPAAGAAKVPGQLAGGRLVVDVSGKVRRPGIYKLPNGARVADALEAAGGVRPGTDVSGLNRARRVVDGEQIVAGGASPGSGARPGAGAAGADPSGGPAAGGAPPGGLMSLSAATTEQLETLPGVGPVLAQHIVEYREEHGGFTSLDQLKEVNGIGERRFADIRPKVSP